MAPGDPACVCLSVFVCWSRVLYLNIQSIIRHVSKKSERRIFQSKHELFYQQSTCLCWKDCPSFMPELPFWNVPFPLSLNVQMHHNAPAHYLHFWLPLPAFLCCKVSHPTSTPPPSLSPPLLCGCQQSQQCLDPNIYERSALISLGQEQHKGSNQRHKLS